MRLDELLQDRLREQADPRRWAINYMMDRRLVVNEHLLLLMAFEPVQERDLWLAELRGWMKGFAEITLKGKNKPIDAKLFVQCLWKGPFEGTEQETMERLLDTLMAEKPDLRRNGKTVQDLIDAVRTWHEEAGRRIERRGDVVGWVETLRRSTSG